MICVYGLKSALNLKHHKFWYLTEYKKGWRRLVYWFSFTVLNRPEASVSAAHVNRESSFYKRVCGVGYHESER
jgi:hypothetical protein